MGSATAAEAAGRGARVLAIDQHSRAHSLGASHGQSRTVRVAYFEHSDYVPLARRALAQWRTLGERVGKRLFHESGVLYMGPTTAGTVMKSAQSAREYGVHHELLESHEVMARWPQFAIPSDWIGFWEPEAGFVRPEECVSAMLELAERGGARVIESAAVTQWRDVESGVEVELAGRRFSAKSLLICAGPWMNKVVSAGSSAIAGGGLTPQGACTSGLFPLSITRQVLGWTHARNLNLSDESRMPCFLIDNGDGEPIYGVPTASDQGNPQGIKIGHHKPGTPCEPDAVDRAVSAADMAPLETAAAKYLPIANGRVHHAVVCMYSLTPDGNFIIDRLPGHERVFVAGGFSGHGFKFAPVVGEALADLALNGSTELPISFLGACRGCLLRR